VIAPCAALQQRSHSARDRSAILHVASHTWLTDAPRLLTEPQLDVDMRDPPLEPVPDALDSRAWGRRDGGLAQNTMPRDVEKKTPEINNDEE
jgi:hypothetical protein